MATGLSSAEAAEQLRRFGPNVPGGASHDGPLRVLVRQFTSPLVLILVFGAVISMLAGEWLDAWIILAIVLGSSALGFIQEYRASAAVAALKERLSLTAQVRRDGTPVRLPVSEIVPEDIVELRAGNLVPADGAVLEARDFLVSEAALTGESFPVEKRAGEHLMLGSSVRSGTAVVRVTGTGRHTAWGAIAARLAEQSPEPEFARGVRHFGYLLMRFMFIVVVFVLAMNQFLGRPALESLLFAVALAVGLTPELLPAIVVVTLARGARDMAAQGVIVRRLQAIEDLGGVDVLCTDKTGTLTEGVVRLESAVDTAGNPSAEVERLAVINASLETGIENPLDAALVAHGTANGLGAEGCRKIDEIPYDFIRRRLTIVVDDGDAARHLIITKGAFENVLEACAIDPAARPGLDAWFRDQGLKGFRVLAVASKRVPAKARYDHADEQAMALAGFLLFFDPPKKDVAKTLRALEDLGIRIKTITGDNRYVAAHLAEAVGLDPGAMLTGAQIAAMNDESLWHLAERTDLFVEIDPQQKERIVRALQRTGHAVGYLGDGINDAPALHAADAGISVEGAVDVARESADIVLVRPDLDVLRQGVVDGRRTFANTLKYISITTSANFGNMVSMALATPLLPFLPLAAKQILLNNFLSDLPSVTIAADNVDEEHLAEPQRWNLVEVRRFMVAFGLVSTAFDLITFVLLLKLFDADEPTFQTAWFVISLLTELAVVLVLRTRRPAWRSRPGQVLLVSTVIVTLASLAVPYAGGFAAAFGFVPLAPSLVLASLAIVAGYVVATEAAKLRMYRAKR